MLLKKTNQVKIDEKIQNIIDKERCIYESLIAFMDNPNESSKEDFLSLVQNINRHDIQKNKERFSHFIELLVNISNNHHRQNGFFDRIERILHNYQNEIKDLYSNNEIYELFESNKRLLYYLIKEHLLSIDETITQLIENKIEVNVIRYSDFFLPEIMKNSNDNNDEILIYYMNHLDEYEEKRQTGENGSYICSLIRQDLVEEFIEYINLNYISLSSTIKPSIFETNIFLIGKEPTLIEYAAFFDSIQIYQYLYLNNVVVK